jgi:hypothetical protein
MSDPQFLVGQLDTRRHNLHSHLQTLECKISWFHVYIAPPMHIERKSVPQMVGAFTRIVCCFSDCRGVIWTICGEKLGTSSQKSVGLALGHSCHTFRGPDMNEWWCGTWEGCRRLECLADSGQDVMIRVLVPNLRLLASSARFLWESSQPSERQPKIPMNLPLKS